MDFRSAPPPRAIAHRGWHIGELAGCENTLAAFLRARAEGFDHLELDVRTTADGELVVFHDETVDRLTTGRGPIAALRWTEVRRLRVAGREPVPLLADVLATLPDALLTIEPKTDTAVEPLISLLAEAGATARACIGSFSSTRMARIRDLGGPELATSLTPGEVRTLLLRGRLGTLPARVVGAQVPLRYRGVPVVGPRLLRSARRAGLEVHCWTVDDPAIMRKLLRMGVDGIMTDRPDLLREVIEEESRPGASEEEGRESDV